MSKLVVNNEKLKELLEWLVVELGCKGSVATTPGLMLHDAFTEEPEPAWKPEPNEDYWIICDDGEIVKTHWEGTSLGKKRLVFGNCFPTREAAEEAKEKIQKVLNQ